jgi:hypothetical protein
MQDAESSPSPAGPALGDERVFEQSGPNDRIRQRPPPERTPPMATIQRSDRARREVGLWHEPDRQLAFVAHDSLGDRGVVTVSARAAGRIPGWPWPHNPDRKRGQLVELAFECGNVSERDLSR